MNKNNKFQYQIFSNNKNFFNTKVKTNNTFDNKRKQMEEEIKQTFNNFNKSMSNWENNITKSNHKIKTLNQQLNQTFYN